MPELIFEHEGSYILINENVVSTLYDWRQTEGETEAGGILIGYRRPPHVEVIMCTTPQEKDQRKINRFIRNDPFHARQALKVWENTNEQAYYIGEWHTHSVDKPLLSFLDYVEWKKLIKSFNSLGLIFMIIGRKKNAIYYGSELVNLSDKLIYSESNNTRKNRT